MAKIELKDKNKYKEVIVNTITPIVEFTMKVTPLLQQVTNPSPDNPNIFYDPRSIGLHIFNTTNSDEYNHLYFTNFYYELSPINAMYYGSLHYMDISGIYTYYTHFRLPGSQITWAKDDPNSAVFYGTINAVFPQPNGETGYSEYFKYIDNLEQFEAEQSDYCFYINQSVIYIKYPGSEAVNTSDESFISFMNHSSFCYSIAMRQIVKPMAPIMLYPNSEIRSTPYNCNIIYNEFGTAVDTKSVTNSLTASHLASGMFIKKTSGQGICPLNGANCLKAPLRKLQVTLPLVQEGSGDASPTNPRPFKIYDKITVHSINTYQTIYSFAEIFNHPDFTIVGNTVIGPVSAFKEHKWKVPEFFHGRRLSIHITNGDHVQCLYSYTDPGAPEGTMEDHAFKLGDIFTTIPIWEEGDTYIWFLHDEAPDDSTITLSFEGYINLEGNFNNSSYAPPFSCTIQLPENVIAGSVELVEGKLQRSILRNNGYVPLLFFYKLININECSIYEVADVTPQVDGTYLSDTHLYRAILLPPSNITIENGNSYCSHYSRGYTSGTFNITSGHLTNKGYVSYIEIFETSFTNEQEMRDYIHNFNEPICFAVPYNVSGYESRDTNEYFYSPLSFYNINSNVEALRIEDTSYTFEYYLNPAKIINSMQTDIDSLKSDLESIKNANSTEEENPTT